MESQEHFFIIGKKYKITIDITKVPIWSMNDLSKNEYIGILLAIPCVKVGHYAGIIIKEINDIEDLTDLPKNENGNNKIVLLRITVDNQEKSFVFNGPLPNNYVTSIEKVE